MQSKNLQPRAVPANQQASGKPKTRPQVKLNVCKSNKSKVTVSGRASYQSNSSIKHIHTPGNFKPSGFCYPKAVSVQHGPLDNHLDFPDESKLMNDVLENIVRKDLKNKYPPLPPRSVQTRDFENKAATPSEAAQRPVPDHFKLGKTNSVGMLKKNFSHKSLAHFPAAPSPPQKFAFNVIRSPQHAKESSKCHSPSPNRKKLISEQLVDHSPAASKDSDCSAPSSSHARDHRHPPSKFRIKVSLCPKPVH